MSRSLEEILEYCERATEGPWRRYGLAGVTSAEYDIAMEFRHICECGEEETFLPLLSGEVAEFIARSRSDLPRVTKELIEARKRLEEAEGLLEAWSKAAGSIGPRGAESLVQHTRTFLAVKCD